MPCNTPLFTCNTENASDDFAYGFFIRDFINGNFYFNDIKKNNTELNELYPSVLDVTEEDVREQLEYDILIHDQPTRKQQIDKIVSLITDTLLSHAKTVRIGNAEVDKRRVDARLRQLEYEHIEYVFDRMEETKSEIWNIRAYLLTALYNAPVTMDSYYTALVNHDLYGS